MKMNLLEINILRNQMLKEYTANMKSVCKNYGYVMIRKDSHYTFINEQGKHIPHSDDVIFLVMWNKRISHTKENEATITDNGPVIGDLPKGMSEKLRIIQTKYLG